MNQSTSTISAFQGVLEKFSFPNEDYPFPESFAIRRYQKKFQKPDLNLTSHLKQKCWDDWLDYDQKLKRVTPSGFLLFKELYKARDKLKDLPRVKLNSFDFPKGSEFYATRGQNSVESRLSRSLWSCTYDNFELFAQFVYNCKAMKRAFRQRYNRWYQTANFVESQHSMDKYIHKRLSSLCANPEWESFKYKLSCITTFTQGSRFSSVPKNNLVRRPINIEPIGNIVVQRQIGNWIRTNLKRLYGLDLDTLAETHGKKIRDATCATIDLKNASDSITLTLCQFLLPRHLFSLLLKSRSEYILGPDKAYHKVEKISSMGNGFTFELMTLILVAVARQFDPSASVFGDDIIISNDKANDLIAVLEGIGFHVNLDKTFIRSKFRESCGANYHDDFGYIESFDFKYPNSIHDCVVFYNKALRLSHVYPTFDRLRLLLRRHIPAALQGVVEPYFFSQEISPTAWQSDPPELSNFFRVRSHESFRNVLTPRLRHKLVCYAQKYNYRLEDLRFFKGFNYHEKLRSPTVRNLKVPRHSAKYEMYLYSGRVAKDVLTGYGDWVSCLFLSVAGATMRWSDSALD